MCGIVGAIQKNNYGFFAAQEDSFFQMLYADVLRGADSTGVIGVERHGGFHIAKEAVEATWVIPQIKAEKFFTDKMAATKAEGKAWIGHNRKSTVGKTNDENAHPFVVNGEFALVHNGTLHNHEKLAKVDVDSQALAIVLHEAMGKDNWKEALEATLGEVFGAYACAWYDARHGKVFLLRNSQRPLSIIETNNAFYWASEGLMAWWILQRNNYKPDEMKHIAVQEHHLISFDVENTKLEVTELSPKKAKAPVVITPTTGARSGNNNGEEAGVDDAHWTKSQRKNFRNAWEGRNIRFWSDDYVERDYPTTIEKGADEVFVLGDCEDIIRSHTVRATISMSQLKLKYKEDIVDRLWSGIITSVDFDKKTGHITVWVDRAKPVVTAPILSHVTKPPFPKNPYVVNNQASLSKAVRDRVSLMRKHYEESFGELDEVVTDEGKIRLIVKTGNNKGQIVYETAVALH